MKTSMVEYINEIDFKNIDNKKIQNLIKTNLRLKKLKRILEK